MTRLRKLLDYAFVPVFVFMTWQLFDLIDRHAVNIPFWDHWEYLVGVWTDVSHWELFCWKHGPHRQGLGLWLTHLLGEATSLDMRAEAFAVGGLLCVAAVLALWLKRRLFGCFHWGDLVIPVVFLSPLQWETVTVVPNPAHGAMPLLLLVALGLAWTVRRRALRYALVLVLDFCLIFTGFGIFAGGVVPVLFALEAWREFRSDDGRPAAPVFAAAVSLLVLGSFFVGYEFDSALPTYRFPDPNWPHYSTVAAISLAAFLRIEGPPGVAIGYALLAVTVWLVLHHVRRIGESRTASRRIVVLMLVMFSCSASSISSNPDG